MTTMMTRKQLRKWTGAAVVAASMTAVALPAFAYRPFGPVQNVCPSCEQGKADVLTLGGGQTIRGTVVGENADFYVVSRYSELRAIPKSEVQGVAWAAGARPGAIGSKDQIVLQNGAVFSGTIIEDKTEPALFQMKSDHNGFTYIVFKDQVDVAYRAGSKIDLGS